MRVLIDATPLLVCGGGVKSFVHGWLDCLLRAPANGVRIGMYPFLARLPGLDHRRSPTTSYSAWLRILASNVMARHCPALQDAVCRKPDVFHASHHIWRAPRGPVVTAAVFDLTCWILPELHLPENVRETRAYAERILKRADRILAISECTRQDCIRILDVPPERIDVIYPAISERLFTADEAEARRVSERWGLAGPYILHLGCLEPRKNLGRLLDAWAEVRERCGCGYELVLAGTDGWAPPELHRRVAAAPGVRRLGYIPEDDLPGLVRGATAIVYPSLYEGFGLPVAQGMAAGVPVVTSGGSSLAEISRGAAVLVDPRSVRSIASAIESVLESSSLRMRLAAAGRRAAEHYRPERCAAASRAFFERAAGGRRI